MGITGLFGELEALGVRPRMCNMAYLRRGTRIVVDGSFFLRKLYNPKKVPGWEFGGDFKRYAKRVSDFVGAFASNGIRLVVVVDGGVDAEKARKWREHRREELTDVRKILAAITTSPGISALPPKFFLPPGGKLAVAEAFAASGCEVVTAEGEADREIAEICVRRGCWGVLSGDSDFLAFPGVPRLLCAETLVARPRRLTVSVIEVSEVCTALGVRPLAMPLFASLAGNDFSACHELSAAHRRISGAFPDRTIFASISRFLAFEQSKGTLAAENQIAWVRSEANRIVGSARGKVELSVLMYSPRALSSGVASPAAQQLRERTLDAIEMAARQTRNVATPLVMGALGVGRVCKGPSVEDPAQQSIFETMRPLRRRLYALLLHRGSGQAEDHTIEEECFSVCFPEESRITTVRPDREFLKSLGEEAFSVAAETVEGRTRRRLGERLVLFFEMLGIDRNLAVNFSQQAESGLVSPIFLGVAAGVRYLCQHARFLGEERLKALVYMAALVDSNDRALPTLPLNLGDATAISMFEHLMSVVSSVNCACGFPISGLTHSKFMDGKLFYFVSNILRAHHGADEANHALVSLWRNPEVFAISKIIALASLSAPALITTKVTADPVPAPTPAPTPVPVPTPVLVSAPVPAPTSVPVSAPEPVPAPVQAPVKKKLVIIRPQRKPH